MELLPDSKCTIQHTVVHPEDWVVCGKVQVCHVATIACCTVDFIVKRFQAVCVLIVVLDPSFIRELREVCVEDKQIIESICPSVPAVVQIRTYQVILTMGVTDPFVWISDGVIPRGKLRVISSDDGRN